ncbi:MAG: hypothetical protein IKS41_03595 [Alphaproteobacteria bacterium]|nr:hypothetical protein [Alphaproteobacteria bacterium]
MLEQQMIQSDNLNTIMANCYGTENYYTNNYLKYNYTDGIKTFCEQASAYWLLSLIQGVYTKYPQMRKDLIAITLMVNDDNTAIITFTDEKGQFYKQRIPYTDCPVGEWKFYFENNVFFWNGEY